jgi:hypothetical protein
VTENQTNTITRRVLDAVDLALDLATLGEYGLEPASTFERTPVDGTCREPAGRLTGWEGFATARRGACGSDADVARRRLRLRELTC